MKKVKQRIAWILPNVLMYIALLVIAVFISVNASALNEINRLGIWILAMILLLVVSVFGTFKIVSWIKQGKM